VDKEALVESFNRLHCCQGERPVYEVPSQHQGHLKWLNVACESCDIDVNVIPGNVEMPSFREGILLNRRFAFAANSCGIDKRDLEILCHILDIGAPPKGFYEVHQEHIRYVTGLSIVLLE
jgi:hypothetical protein